MTTSPLHKFREKIDNLKGRRDQIKTDIVSADKRIEALKKSLSEWEEVRRIIQTVAEKTQAQLRYVIEPPVNQALAGVFDNPYEFELRFETKMGRTSAQQIFKRGKQEYKDLMFSGGGGAVDVAAFALQVAGLCLSPYSRILLMDEPLKHLKSRNHVYEERGSLMIQETSHKINMQVIMISHIAEQQKGSDKVFRLSLKKGKTIVEE